MGRILKFTSSPEDWKELLADPTKLWRVGYSARALAYCWEAADGFPPEIAKVLEHTDEAPLQNLKLSLAIPEFKVPLPGGSRASQNDLFVLAHGANGPVSIMVEGKVNESFGPTLDEWRRGDSQGKKLRIQFVADCLGLRAEPPGYIRYQLLHRATSAVVAGQEFWAAAALILVHSFSEQRAGWSDYQAVTALFSVDAKEGVVQRLGRASKIPLFGIWVPGDRSFLRG